MKKIHIVIPNICPHIGPYCMIINKTNFLELDFFNNTHATSLKIFRTLLTHFANTS